MYTVIEVAATDLPETLLEEVQAPLIRELIHLAEVRPIKKLTRLEKALLIKKPIPLAEVRRPIKDHIQLTEAVALVIVLTTEALQEVLLLEVAEDHLLAAQEDVDNH